MYNFCLLSLEKAGRWGETLQVSIFFVIVAIDWFFISTSLDLKLNTIDFFVSYALLSASQHNNLAPPPAFTIAAETQDTDSHRMFCQKF